MDKRKISYIIMGIGAIIFAISLFGIPMGNILGLIIGAIIGFFAYKIYEE